MTDPRERTLEAGGHRLRYVDHGGDGPTIVLVHGLGGSAVNWLSVAPGLAACGRVVAVDLPGFGRSERGARGSSLPVLGDALARFVDAVSDAPVHLVGNSMGGALSLLEAHARPERVRSAVLVCPALPPVPGKTSLDPAWMTTMLLACLPFGHRLLRRRAARLGPERQVRELMALCCVDPSRIAPEVLAAHIERARARAAGGSDPAPWARLAFAEAARSLMGELLLGHRLRQATQADASRLPPVLIVQGQRDRLVDMRSARAVAFRNPAFRLVELPDIGHVPMLEAPAALLALALPFLRSPSRLAHLAAPL